MAHNKSLIPKLGKIFLIFCFLFLLTTLLAKPIYSQPDCPNCQYYNNCTGPCATCAFCHGPRGVSPTIPYQGQPLGKFEGIGPLGNFVKTLTSQDISAPLGLLNKVVSIIIGLITAIAFIYFIFVFFTGGLAWISSGGDAKSIEKAQKQITTGIIGLVVVAFGIFIIQIIGTILGIDILKPFDFLKNIW